MPSGVYDRETLSRPYRGLERVRMDRRRDGCGTEAIVRARCCVCAVQVERTASAVRLAAREGRGLYCDKHMPRRGSAGRIRGAGEQG